jgi:hypothetical protein
MEVVLKHKKKDSWAGVIKYKGCFDYISPVLTRSGNKHTGLTEEDAIRLEKALGLEKDTLAPFSKYWSTFAIKISAKETYLDTSRPWDELQYLFLRNHKRVANGVNDLKPMTEYIIINKDSEAQESNKINKRKREAIKEFDKLSLDDMRKCLRLLGYKSDTMSSELVESKLFELVERDPEVFFSKWVDNKSKDTEVIIQTALAKNIMRKNKNAYYYGTEIIGTSLEDTVAYLNNKNNQDLRMAIMNELESK